MKKTITPIAFHRRLFTEAWSLVRARKSLWAFGLFAGLSLSGTVVEPAFSALARVARLGAFWMQLRLDDWSEATVPFGSAVTQVCRVDPLLSNVSLTLFIMLGIGVAMWMFVCEGALLAGLTGKDMPRRSSLVRRGWREACALFVLNAVGRAFQLVLVLLLSLPILFYLQGGDYARTFAAMLGILLFVPLSAAGHIVTMLSSVHLVRKDTNVPEAVEAGLRIFAKHWLVAFETGFLLLVAGALALLGFGAAATLAGIPIVLIFAIAHYSGQLLGVAAVAALAILVFCALLLCFAGLLTTYRYAVWTRFYDRVSHPLTGSRVVARLKRWFHPHHVR